jgi:hypothetical protein
MNTIRFVIGVSLLLLVGGCVGYSQVGGTRGILLELEQPLRIRAYRAHAKFQAGRQVAGVNRYEPWCQLEIDTVAEQPQRVETGRFPVREIVDAFIKDYDTRMPALLGGLSCDDLVFMERTMWVDRAASPQILYLRCFAPYTNCRFGPSLTLQQMQAVTGPAVKLHVGTGPGSDTGGDVQ